jgi:hypothetical protein
MLASPMTSRSATAASRGFEATFMQACRDRASRCFQLH